MTTTSDANGHLHNAAGAPASTGGQFAAKRNAKQTGRLEVPADLVRDASAVSLKTARHMANTFRMDPSKAQDMVQDFWVEVSKRQQTKGDIVDRLAEPAWVKLVTRTLATKNYGIAQQQGFNDKDVRARKMLDEREQTFREQHGRNMTPSERKAAADEIRLSFEPRRRPKEDFYERIDELSIDVPVGEDAGATLGDLIVEDAGIDFTHGEDMAGTALNEIEQNVATKQDIRESVWRIVSVENGAPQPIPGSLDRKQLTAHKKAIAAAGGVTKVVGDWFNGNDVPEDAEAALFAPFGDLDMKGSEQVAAVFDKHRGFADKLWAAAAQSATA